MIINIGRKEAVFFGVVILVLTIVGFGVAYGGNQPDVMGHSAGEVGGSFVPLKKYIFSDHSVFNASGALDLGALMGESIPSGATHVMIRVQANIDCGVGANCVYRVYFGEYPNGGDFSNFIVAENRLLSTDAGNNADHLTESINSATTVVSLAESPPEVGWFVVSALDTASNFDMGVWVEGYFIG